MTIASKPLLPSGVHETLELVRSLPPERRRVLAIELAPRRDAPRELMRLLAQDEIVIAEPVILESPVLSDQDLCAIAELGSPSHAARLRRRPNLPAAVLDILDRVPSNEAALIASLRARNIEKFRSMLDELTGGEASAALKALESGTGVKLARECKRADLSRASYSAIVLLWGLERDRSRTLTNAILDAYDVVLVPAHEA